MQTEESRKAIEAILLVSDIPIDASLLAQLLEIPKTEVEKICTQLMQEYKKDHRGFVLVNVAGGYRYQTDPTMAPYVERFVLEGQNSRLSSAALETLAIIAYKQPISRMQISAIRGVNVDAVIRTLQQRGYIGEVGKDPGPGNAILFGTTSLFLERLGINDISDLPPLANFVPGADVVEALEGGLRPDHVGEKLESQPHDEVAIIANDETNSD
ncbi:MAG: SMC-Scp complex subunit ScpB [Acidimicrobiaceae bacterium]|jgi:segregation and condensation protein B|nr:SMC-Scp complex subunit ScpB [Acidimicrobiaceae bacterium]|tara:strand:+ start:17316 stop:17954 length:639 start_codon:yes stop_codon:yes gene_type:complete